MAATVTTNDRQFTCTLQSCGVDDPTGRLVGSINVHADFLDIDALRADLFLVSREVSRAVMDFRQWIESKESDFEMKYLLREITPDVSIFNRINATIAKLRQHRATLASWHSNFQELVSLALDYMATYSESEALLRNLGSTMTVVGGLPQSPIMLAKQNLSKSKSIQKQINAAIMADARIRTVMISIQTQLESFARGIIKVDDKLLDLNDIDKLVDGLSAADTPLARVQSQLASIVNSSKTAFELRTAPPAPVVVPTMDFLAEKRDPASARIKTRDLAKKLEIISANVLYTDSTRARLESLIQLVQNYVPSDDPERERVDEMVRTIRRNIPTVVLQNYRSKIRRRSGIYLRMQDIRDIISNLNVDDRIYEPEFRAIYDEMHDVALKYITPQLDEDAGGGGGSGASGALDVDGDAPMEPIERE